MALIKESAHSYYSGDNLGSYQFISLDHVVNNFMIGYVGENKIISKAKRVDVSFYAQRALQELSYDTLRSVKSQEILINPSCSMKMPQDYVNYVKLTWVDDSGIEHVIYPTSKTSNPTKLAQDSNGNYIFPTKNNGGVDPEGIYEFPLKLTLDSLGPSQSNFDIYPHSLGFADTDSLGFPNNVDTNPLEVGMEIISPYFPAGTTISKVYNQTSGQDFAFDTSNPSLSTISTLTNVSITIKADSVTWDRFKNIQPTEQQENYDDEYYVDVIGQRYGLDPQHANVNGSFYIDNANGTINFSSNINGKRVILKYVSDGLGTEEEMIVHKFAEEAIYKHIAYAIVSTTFNAPENLVARLKKDRFAETRKAKLRLSNIKLEELTQILRGKSKHIKH